MAAEEGIALVDKDADGVDRAFRADVLAGLAQAQKAVPARWFYDEEGSRLFEDITRLPEGARLSDIITVYYRGDLQPESKGGYSDLIV